ncbi:hypothetical protein [Roseovarius sp.]|uniref:hypothetical protein n=1 Tax=Roseovarius sp. TaxID=1486281 RepID=UPI0025E1F41C|nr:hypothetical protein [Roseovarius sp.]
MSSSTQKYTSGLVFLGMRTFDIVTIGNRACATLDRLDEHVNGLAILSDDEVVARTENFELRIENKPDYLIPTLERPAAHFLALTLTRSDMGTPEDTQASLSIMAHVLRILHRALSPDFVEWTDPQILLSSADFQLATTLPDEDATKEEQPLEIAVAPSRVVPRRHVLPEIEETNLMLQARLSRGHRGERALRMVFLEDQPTAPEPQEDIREKTAPLRLSVWMMTITLGLFALPMAAALVVINLLRGENLRLTSQTAALTGTFITLQTFGTTAQAMTVVQGILG